VGKTFSSRFVIDGARVDEVPFEFKTTVCADAELFVPVAQKDRRIMMVSLFAMLPHVAPVVYDGNWNRNIEQAYLYRSLQPLVEMTDEFYSQFRSFTQEFCHLHFDKCVPMDFEDWLSTTSYTLVEKRRLRLVNDDLGIGFPCGGNLNRYVGFVKAEVYPSFKAPRMIHAPTNVMKVLMGPRIKAIENLIFLDKRTPFVKHYTIEQRKQGVRDLGLLGYRVYSLDQKSFESHIVTKFMDACECEVYRWVLSSDPYVDDICRSLIGLHKINTRTGVKVLKKGRRNSGDMCTSLGNGLTSWLLLEWIIVHVKHGVYRALIEGDDVIVATSVELTDVDFKNCGFDVTLQLEPDAGHASFCGLIFGSSGQVIRDPRRFVLKFGWIFDYVEASNYILDSLQHGKALSALYETPHCPIVGVWARTILEQVGWTHPRFVEDDYHRHIENFEVPEFAPTLETRLLFSEVYGYDVSEQLAIESACMKMDFALIVRLMKFEECDYFMWDSYVHKRRKPCRF